MGRHTGLGHFLVCKCGVRLNSCSASPPSSKTPWCPGTHFAGMRRLGPSCCLFTEAPGLPQAAPTSVFCSPLHLQLRLVTDTRGRCPWAPGASGIWVLYLRTRRKQRPQMAFAALPTPGPVRHLCRHSRHRAGLQLEPPGACVTGVQRREASVAMEPSPELTDAEPGLRGGCHGEGPLFSSHVRSPSFLTAAPAHAGSYDWPSFSPSTSQEPGRRGPELASGLPGSAWVWGSLPGPAPVPSPTSPTESKSPEPHIRAEECKARGPPRDQMSPERLGHLPENTQPLRDRGRPPLWLLVLARSTALHTLVA